MPSVMVPENAEVAWPVGSFCVLNLCKTHCLLCGNKLWGTRRKKFCNATCRVEWHRRQKLLKNTRIRRQFRLVSVGTACVYRDDTGKVWLEFIDGNPVTPEEAPAERVATIDYSDLLPMVLGGEEDAPRTTRKRTKKPQGK